MCKSSGINPIKLDILTQIKFILFTWIKISLLTSAEPFHDMLEVFVQGKMYLFVFCKTSVFFTKIATQAFWEK
jgi:hypothetical protein